MNLQLLSQNGSVWTLWLAEGKNKARLIVKYMGRHELDYQAWYDEWKDGDEPAEQYIIAEPPPLNMCFFLALWAKNLDTKNLLTMRSQ